MASVTNGLTTRTLAEELAEKYVQEATDDGLVYKQSPMERYMEIAINEALEQAAKECDELINESKGGLYAYAAVNLAARIRALKSK